jgi:hypothetical protein
MKRYTLLTVMSLLSILLMTLHVTDDIVRGISPAAPDNVGAVAIFLVWLVGTLLLSERRSGYVIQAARRNLCGGDAGPSHEGGRYPTIATSPGGFFFIWSLIVVGTTGAFATILAARALWGASRGKRDGRN